MSSLCTGAFGAGGAGRHLVGAGLSDLVEEMGSNLGPVELLQAEQRIGADAEV